MSSLLRNASMVFSVNTLLLFLGLVSGFLIPRFLGISEYAFLKTFSLYLSYAGVFSFGFVDSIYLQYGGYKYEIVDKKIFGKETFFFLYFVSIIALLILLVGVSLNSLMLILLGLCIVPVNMIGFFKLFYQSVGEFGVFVAASSLQGIMHIISVLVIVFFINIARGSFFVIALIIENYFVFLYIWFRRKDRVNVTRLEMVFIRENFSRMSSGFVIMIGNLSSMFFYSMDRWFVKILLKTEDFAFYSFATSMMGMVMILVSSVAMTFYPMLVRRQEEEGLLRSLKSYLMILGVFAGAAYFGFDFIVNWILRDYLPSLEVIAILFAGFPTIAVINAIYVNMYKAQKVEKKYFFTVFGMVAISFGLNALAVIINKSNWTIAAATTIAFYFWFFFSSKDFKGTKTNSREIAYLSAFLIVFFSTTRLLPWWLGLPLYLAGIFGITLLFYKKEFFELISKVSGALIRKTRAV